MKFVPYIMLAAFMVILIVVLYATRKRDKDFAEYATGGLRNSVGMSQAGLLHTIEEED